MFSETLYHLAANVPYLTVDLARMEECSSDKVPAFFFGLPMLRPETIRSIESSVFVTLAETMDLFQMLASSIKIRIWPVCKFLAAKSASVSRLPDEFHTAKSIFGAIRVLVRSTLGHGFGIDDFTLGAATASALIQSSFILGACSKGFGKALRLVSPEAQEEAQKMYYTSNIFFLLAIGVAKISVICFLHRISQMRQHRFVFNIAMGIIAAWTFGSIMALSLQCNLRHPWIFVNENCPGIDRRWQILGVLDIASEAAIVGLVVFLVYRLQTPVSSKAAVVGIFSFRLLIIIFIGFRLHTFDQAGYSTNPFIREAPFVAWTQSELTYSLISATIPTFQNFLKNLNTGFGGIGAAGGNYGYGYGSDNHSRAHKYPSKSFQMSKLRSANRGVGNEEPDVEYGGNIAHAPTRHLEGPNAGPSTAMMGHGNGSEGANGETTSIGSDESRRMMIRKEIQWSIRTEPKQRDV